MELQLGLALPTQYPSNSKPDLHLNSRAYHPIPNPNPNPNKDDHFSSFPFNHKSHNKRTFSQLFEHDAHTYHNISTTISESEVMLPTLSLLPLTPANSSLITKNNGNIDVEAVVGWPPVNSFRKNNYGDEEVAGNDQMAVWIHHHHHHHHHQQQQRGHGLRGSNTNTLLVKVKMEGVGIARKVNLRMHHSFHTLNETLMDMFGKCHHQHSNRYELAYQDREGDWLLADDVPWRSFIQCARRLKLVKNSR